MQHRGTIASALWRMRHRRQQWPHNSCISNGSKIGQRKYLRAFASKMNLGLSGWKQNISLRSPVYAFIVILRLSVRFSTPFSCFISHSLSLCPSFSCISSLLAHTRHSALHVHAERKQRTRVRARFHFREPESNVSLGAHSFLLFGPLKRMAAETQQQQQ